MFLHKPDPELVRRLDALEQRLDILSETDGRLLTKANQRFMDFASLTRERLDNHSESLGQLIKNLDAVAREVSSLRGDLDAVEQKLDELLTAQDAEARSIPTEEAKPEPPNVMPGHIPWSQRKAQREATRRSPDFINRVKKAAAPTDPKPEAPK